MTKCVSGNVQDMISVMDFEQSYDELVTCSPEISALFSEVKQRRRQLCREIAEPIPNLTWQATVQYDVVTDDVVTGFQMGVPIPKCNRNQGAIHQATTAQHQIGGRWWVAHRHVNQAKHGGGAN